MRDRKGFRFMSEGKNEESGWNDNGITNRAGSVGVRSIATCDWFEQKDTKASFPSFAVSTRP